MENKPKMKERTVEIQFPFGFPRPAESEIIKYLMADGVKGVHVEAIYPEIARRSIYVKFVEEEQFFAYLKKKGCQTDFVYANGVKIEIRIGEAGEGLTMVRLFEIPPEVDDEKITAILEEFGEVKEIRWGKIKGPEEFAVYNGMRFVFMKMRKEIPNLLTIDGKQRRVRYDGEVEHCYKSGEAGHKRYQCPLSVNQRLSNAAGASKGPPARNLTNFPNLVTPTNLIEVGMQQNENVNNQSGAIKSTLQGKSTEVIAKVKLMKPTGDGANGSSKIQTLNKVEADGDVSMETDVDTPLPSDSDGKNEGDMKDAQG